MYEPLFQNLVAELDSGIDFVVKLREDLLDTIATTATAEPQHCTVQHLKVCRTARVCNADM
jgi:hypothetical protein